MNHHDNSEEIDEIIKAYVMYKPMLDDRMYSDNMNADRMDDRFMMHNKEMMKNETTRMQVKQAMEILKNNILSTVCPLTFDLRFKHHPKNHEVHIYRIYKCIV